MALDDLLETLERRDVVTLVTPCTQGGVTAKPLQHKACTLVTPVTPQNGNTAAGFDAEWFEERAGIYEFDAGFPRHEAEMLARKEVTQWQTLSAWPTLQ